MVHLLRFCTSTAGGIGLIPGQGTKIPHAVWHGFKKKEIEYKTILMSSQLCQNEME